MTGPLREVDHYSLLGRPPLFADDMSRNEGELDEAVAGARILLVGGAGTIGRAVAREIFSRRPRTLHVVDLSENNLVELVRDLRSSLGYMTDDFRALPLDSESAEFRAFLSSQPSYDWVLNLSALKHVRSEKDPYTLMRMLQVNILNAYSLAEQASAAGSSKMFAVSTDKAANPANMMGASKRIMERQLTSEELALPVSFARFANVMFSDGSLLHGFRERFLKRQPIAAPSGVTRYFMTSRESGELCLLSCAFGENRDLFYPRASTGLRAIGFPELARAFLEGHGFEVAECETEEEARKSALTLIARGRWPCYFFKSDTTGEKEIEEFVAPGDTPKPNRFRAVGVVSVGGSQDEEVLKMFRDQLDGIRQRGKWTKRELVELVRRAVPEMSHEELNKSLDERM